MVKIILEDVCKNFGNIVAVDNVNMNVHDRELLVLLGPSGSGKSTILNLIAGLESVSSGNIYFDNTLVNSLSPKDRDVAMVFQSYALYPHMSVFDNIAFSLKLRKMPKNEIRVKVKEVARFLHIENLLNRKPGELSGGQKQRTALGRAIIRNPKVFLMDEPLSNLDAKLRLQMRAELKSLQKQLQITTIYVTHDQLEAMTLAGRIAVLKEGRLQQVATPHRIYSKPDNLFVADFIGSPPMNFLDCSLQEIDGKIFFNADSFIYYLPYNFHNILEKYVGTELIFGIRPEDIIVNRKRKANSIETVVYLIEPLGNSQIILLQKDKNMIRATIDPNIHFNIGDKVWINLDVNKIHLFRKTGELIL